MADVKLESLDSKDILTALKIQRENMEYMLRKALARVSTACMFVDKIRERILHEDIDDELLHNAEDAVQYLREALGNIDYLFNLIGVEENDRQHASE